MNFLLGILAAYPMFYILDRYARPRMDGGLDMIEAFPDNIIAPNHAQESNAMRVFLEEIYKIKNNLDLIDRSVEQGRVEFQRNTLRILSKMYDIEHSIREDLRRINIDTHIAIENSTERSILEPLINDVSSTWQNVLDQGRRYGIDSETELYALTQGYERVSRNIITIFTHVRALLINASSVESVFHLFMHAWRCGLSVEALYFERQKLYGPDVPVLDADLQLKNKYEQYLRTLHTTLVSVCINRIQRKQVNEAIKTFEQITNIRAFIYPCFEGRQLDRTIHEELDFIINQTYSEPNHLPSIIGFIRDLPLTLFSEMPSEKIRLYRKVLNQMKANNHHVHPYGHIFVLATSIKHEMEHMPPNVTQQISEDGMVKIAKATSCMEQDILKVREIFLQPELEEITHDPVKISIAKNLMQQDILEIRERILQRELEEVTDDSETNVDVELQCYRNIIFKYDGYAAVDVEQMPLPVLIDHYHRVMQELIDYETDGIMERYNKFKQSQKIEGKFLALTVELPPPVRRLIFNQNGVRLLHMDWRDGRKNYFGIEDNFPDVTDFFFIIPIEWGAFFLLYNKRSDRYISGGKNGYGNQDAPETHWKPTIAPHINRLFFQCREGNNNYLYKRVNTRYDRQVLHPCSLEIENVSNAHHPLEFDEQNHSVFDKSGILWKVKNPHNMFDEDSDDEHEFIPCCLM